MSSSHSSSPPSVIHPRGGALTLQRLGVRVATTPGSLGITAPQTCDTVVAFSAEDPAPGKDAIVRRLGAVEIELRCRTHGDAATLSSKARNLSDQPIQLESAFIGLSWTGPGVGRGGGPGGMRFLRSGWQSWSFNGMRDLDDVGQPAFPSGEWLRGLHHAVGAPPADRDGWHESSVVTVAGVAPDGPACLAGVLETGIGFGCVYLQSRPGSVAVDAEIRLEVVLEPGETRQLESVRVALGDDGNRLLENFAELWGTTAGARRSAPFQAGWCSWYHFFHDVTEDDMLRNLHALTALGGEIPIEVVQLDDGYQRAIGDWLVTNDKFPRGIEPIAREIREAGFRPGIWTAPLCAVDESRLFIDHPEWFLKDGGRDGQPFRSFAHPVWSKSGWVYALDTTQDPVIDHLRQLFSALVAMGFTYLKLDFLFAVAMRADASDPRVTRAERLRRGLDAVRAGAGDDAFLLGCGCPMGPAVGVVDGMRIGPDVAPSWLFTDPAVIPGFEPAIPSTESAVRSIIHRAWMHRRLWLNDPDCLMARTSQTALTADEIRTLSATIAVTGGMVVFSDDVPVLEAEDRARVTEVIELAREVDDLDRVGRARAGGWFDPRGIQTMSARGPERAMVALINVSDEPETVTMAPSEHGLAGHLAPVVVSDQGPEQGPSGVQAALGSVDPRIDVRGGEPVLGADLAIHGSALYRLPERTRLAVFCDFDGTFSTTDVGLTLALTHAADRIPAAQEGLVAGELTAWQFTCEMLDGLELSEAKLADFLADVELDPGASELVAWCRDRDVPFRILSDGFDHVLDHLRQQHGVPYDHDANHLRFRDDRWSIAPAHPDPGCFCGTGTCKRSRIVAWREQHPGSFCVHIGNGRISDLCGAIEADMVFAKDSLAAALVERGVAHQPFTTLRDVIAGLENRLAARR